MMRSLILCVLTMGLLLTPTTRLQAGARDFESLRQSLGVPRWSVQTLELGLSVEAVRLDLEGRRVTLRLHPSNMRAQGFRLLVERADGMHEVPAPPAHTYRGTVDEIPGSFVGGTIRDGQLRAAIALGDGRLFYVQPLVDLDPAADPSPHVVLDASQMGDVAGMCEVSGPAVSVPPGTNRGTGTAALKPAELAFDADFEFYAMNNSDVGLTVDDIQNVMSAVNTVYERDCGITHYLTTVIVRTVTTDPYNSTDANTMLDEFRNHWNASQSGVRRDVAHLMTGKELMGQTLGISIVGTICIRSQAYGLSQSRFSTILARRCALTAHELGHSWNAIHCDSALPCNIMCSTINGCSGIGLPNFEPMGIAAITNFAASRTCLNPPAGVGPSPSDWLRLATPSPTPFSDETVLRFYLEQRMAAQLDIYDIAGQHVVRLTEGVQDTGWHQVDWSGQDHLGRAVRSGIYYACLRAAGVSLSRKLVLIR